MNNKTRSLAIVALAVVAVTTLGFYTPVQDVNARCKGGSVCQHNRQCSHISAAIISRSNAGNQAASNSVTVRSGCDSCGIGGEGNG